MRARDLAWVCGTGVIGVVLGAAVSWTVGWIWLLSTAVGFYVSSRLRTRGRGGR